METINPIVLEEATGKTRELLERTQAEMGMIPILLRVQAHSPAALEANLNDDKSLSKGSLSPKQREQIALTVAQTNGCPYCQGIHVHVSKLVGMSDTEIQEARQGRSPDARTDVLLRFVKTLVLNRGTVPESSVPELRAEGFSDSDIVEIIANVAWNISLNYLNLVTRPAMDIPAAPEIS